MSLALRCPALSRQATYTHARRISPNKQLLIQLAHFHPNQLSSYIGVKLLLPAKGRTAMTPQGSAAVRKPVQMSFLGVGAPEAILVAIVALVVFGPKGLAEAARSVGSTLRAFKPTIQEVVQVSQELKGTLEKELGINELRDAARPTVRPITELDMTDRLPSPMSDTVAKVLDSNIEAKRAASAQMAWGAPAAAGSIPEDGAAAGPVAAASSGAVAAATATLPALGTAAPAPVKDIASMSMEELEAELARRRTGAAGGLDKR